MLGNVVSHLVLQATLFYTLEGQQYTVQRCYQIYKRSKEGGEESGLTFFVETYLPYCKAG